MKHGKGRRSPRWRTFDVVISDRRGRPIWSSAVWATSVGNACRKAFRLAIRGRIIKRQPRTTPDGFFEGVSVS